MEEKKEFIEGAEVIVSTVELKMNSRNPDSIDKVTFISDKGNITWKPKIQRSHYEGGFKVTETVAMEKDFIPEKLSNIAQIANETGKVKLKVCYHTWQTEMDGNPITYRFILSLKQFEEWEIIKEEVKTETVK